jgi:sugar/nucleoside kinase (ribokinase family)
MRIIIVGELNCDLFYRNEFFKTLEDRVAKLVADRLSIGNAPDEVELKAIIHEAIASLPKKNPSEAFVKRGGNGNNSAELFGKLGLPIKFVTARGAGSEWMRDELDAIGIDTSCVFELPDMQPISTIIEDPTTTKIFTGMNLKAKMNFSSIDLDATMFSGASVVLFTPLSDKHKPLLDVVQATNEGQTIAATIEQQAAPSMPALEALLDQPADILFLNDADALTMTGAESLDDADALVEPFGRIRVYTQGSKGTIVKSSLFEDVVVPVFQVDVVDRTGAGDAFAAGFLLQCHECIEASGPFIPFIESLPAEERQSLIDRTGRFASAVAALKISTGCTPGKQDVEDFLDMHLMKENCYP